MANVFISYRRADSRAITDNIHGHLARLIGDEYVFQDVLDIPVGVNFRDYLKTNLDSADVLLVIIGQRWLTITGENGQRRLDNPDDAVRMEVATALKNPKLLVIPILVDDAPMPDASMLPDDLRELHYRNAARVRYNPDFEHDMQILVKKIQQHVALTSLTPSAAYRRPASFWYRIALLGLLIAVVGAITLFILNNGKPFENQDPLPTVATGQYMVLVTDIIPISTQNRPVAQVIVENLRQSLEQDIPFSTLRVRYYPIPVTNETEAQALAEQVGASIIIWGDYAAETVNLRLQVGSFDAFPTIAVLPRDIITRAANIRLRLNHEQEDSIAPHVVSMMILLQTADSDGYAMISALAALDLLPPPTAEVVSTGIAGRVHKALIAYVSETEISRAELDAVLDIDTNALIYALRGYTLQRLGLNQAALEDAQTVRSLAPEWILPLYIRGNDGWMFANDPLSSRRYFDEMVAARPNDWFPLFNRAFTYYLVGDYASVAIDVTRIIDEFSPPTSLPYALAVSIAIREGNLAEVAAIKAIVTRQFPNPTEFNRFFKALYGQADAVIKYGQGVNAVMYLTLGQFSRALTAADAAITIDPSWADMYLVQGIAHCNLDDTAQANMAYTQAIEVEPDLAVAYLMRAQVRSDSGDVVGAATDIFHVQATPWGQRPDIAALIEQGLRGEITCKTFF